MLHHSEDEGNMKLILQYFFFVYLNFPPSLFTLLLLYFTLNLWYNYPGLQVTWKKYLLFQRFTPQIWVWPRFLIREHFHQQSVKLLDHDLGQIDRCRLSEQRVRLMNSEPAGRKWEVADRERNRQLERSHEGTRQAHLQPRSCLQPQSHLTNSNTASLVTRQEILTAG